MEGKEKEKDKDKETVTAGTSRSRRSREGEEKRYDRLFLNLGLYLCCGGWVSRPISIAERGWRCFAHSIIIDHIVGSQ